jgi:hypothetical protein
MPMKRLVMAAGLGAGLLLSIEQVDAQWQYTDDTGASKVTQYKLDVPAPHRDAAVWVGPTGVGNPALSADQVRLAQRWEAVRRLVAAEAELLRYRDAPPPARVAARPDPGPTAKAPTTMCVAGTLQAMVAPGSWRVVGTCAPGFSTGYGTDGYGSYGSFTIR